MEEQNKILRLVKPKRKGIWGIVFSRFLIIALLMVVQILLFLTIFHWFEESLPYYTVLQLIFTVVMILYLFNNTMDYSAKLTWLAILAVAPLPGAALLFWTQINLGHRAIQKRTAQLIEESRGLVEQDPACAAKLRDDPFGTDDLVRYLNRSGSFPVFDHTAVTYFPLGEKKFEAMLPELEKAEKYIYLEYFIVEEGYMWGSILNVLARKAKEGVDVRVMYDGMCEFMLLPHDYPKRLEKLGIKAKVFSPVTPFVSSHYNYRDHRKILVIDGKVAFNGGVNLADEYINRKEVYGHWKDTAVMLKGDAARSFALLFLQMWNLTEETADFSICETGTALPEDVPGYVIPFGDSPLDGDKVGRSVYMDIFNRSHTYVHVMTPYLILDGELKAAIQFAAERGVEVKLILPGVPDKKVAYALAKSHYKELLDAGVEIYEYTPGFVHAKVLVSDGRKATVGTINLDYRSLYHHFECATYLYEVPCIADIEVDFQETLTKCRRVTYETIQHEKLGYKLMGGIMKLVAPLM